MINIEIDKNYKQFETFSKDIKNYFSKNSNTIKDKRNVLKIIEYDRQKVVVKSFKIPNLINQFAYRFLRDSKAKRSYLNAQKLIELDINTPHPISYIEFFEPLLKESFYICKYFDYDFEIREVFTNSDFLNRENILREFIKFSYDLHQKGVFHIDYSPGNILVKKIENDYMFSIIDVNRMKFIKFNNKLRFKNLSKFFATKSDIEFMAKEYAKISKIDEKECVENILNLNEKHKNKTNLKKRLKGKKVAN